MSSKLIHIAACIRIFSLGKAEKYSIVHTYPREICSETAEMKENTKPCTYCVFSYMYIFILGLKYAFGSGRD